MKICQVGADLFHSDGRTDGQTDMTKLIVTLRSFAEAPKKVRKVTISFVMSVCPSVRVEQIGSHLTDFHEIQYLIIFGNFDQKIQA
jgi:hypothetical protein